MNRQDKTNNSADIAAPFVGARRALALAGARRALAFAGFAFMAFAALSAGGADNAAPRPAQMTKADAAQNETIHPAARHPASSFTITDYHRWRDNIARASNKPASSSFPQKRESTSLPNGNLRDSANGGFAAAFGKPLSAQSALVNLRTWTNTQLRADGDIWRGAVVDIANGNDKSANFNAFYEKAQMQMFSAIDNAFAVYATDSLVGSSKSVKSAKIEFQSALGNRKAQLGIDVIGAIHEKHYDDSANKYAIGWQAHIYAAEGENKGASGGIFYRRIQNNILYGVNAFADYERHQYGDFYRYGIGGEVQNQHIAFGANYYAPLTDDIPINAAASVVAFSRKGYDANLRIAIPGARYLQAEAAYYYYDGREDGSFGENKVEADEGFRYGAALSPGNGIVLKVFYDDGGEEFGGELSWLHKFNNPAQADPQRYDTPFVADLFAPVLREHSQRIALATIRSALPPPLRFEALAERHIRGGRYTPVMAVHIPPDYFDGPPSFEVRNFRLYNNSLHITLPNATVFFEPTATTFDTDVEVFVRGMVNGVLTATSFHRNYRTASPAGFYNFNPAMAHITSTLESTVGVFSPYANFDGGGIGPFFCYSSHADVRIVRRDNSREEGGDCLVLFDTENRQKTITVTLTSEDGTTDFPPATRRLILTAVAGFTPAESLQYIVGVQAVLGLIALPGGSVVSPLPAGVSQNGGMILFSTAIAGARAIGLTIGNDRGEMIIIPPLQVVVQPVAQMGAAVVSGSQGRAFVAGEDIHFIASITAGGGYVSQDNNYNFTFSRADFALFGSGASREVRYGNNAETTVTATLVVDDDNEHTAPVSLFFTVTTTEPIASFGPADDLRVVAGMRSVVATVQTRGGAVGALTYTLISGADAGFSVVGNSVVLSAATPNNNNDAVAAVIEVDDTSAQTSPLRFSVTANVFMPVAVRFNQTNNPNGGVFLTSAAARVYGIMEVSGGVGGNYTRSRVSGPGINNIDPSNGRVVVEPRGMVGRHVNVYEFGDAGTNSDITPNVRFTLTIPIATRRAVTASVHFLSRVTPGAIQGGYVVISTNVKRRLVLPADFGDRPITLWTDTRDWRNEPGHTSDANAFRIVQRGGVPAGNINLPNGSNWRYLGGFRRLFVTIVANSEEIIGTPDTSQAPLPATPATPGKLPANILPPSIFPTPQTAAQTPPYRPFPLFPIAPTKADIALSPPKTSGKLSPT